MLYNIFQYPFRLNNYCKIELQLTRKVNLYDKKGMKQLFLSSILFFTSILGYANHPLVRNFQRETYNAGTQNWAIIQDQSNIMYFANNSGLLVYDGIKWSTIPIKNKTNVRSLHEKNGRFYASTFNEFGYFAKQANNQYAYTSLSEKLNITNLESNALFSIIDGENKIYFVGEKNIYEYDDLSIEKIAFHSRIDASAYVNSVLFITSEQSGVFMLNGKQFVRLPGSEVLANKKVCTILALDPQNVLFITSFNSVYLFNGATFTPYNTGIDPFLKQNQVFCAVKNQTKLVFGTVQKGIAILDLSNKSVTYLNSFSGLQNNTVLSMAFDNQMNLWLGLDKGIDYVMLNIPIQSILGRNDLFGSGYTSFLKGNTLYMGTNQGLYTTSYPLVNEPVPMQLKLIRGMEGQIWCLTEIDGTLFCGDDQGAFIVSQNKVERIDKLAGTWNFKRFLKRKDLILGCSYQGLFVLKKTGNGWNFSHFIKGNFSESSPMFEEDDDETIWFSHWLKGMFRLTLNANKDSIVSVKLYNNKGFPGNQNNTVFRVSNKLIFSSERGFFIFNRLKDRMDPYTNWNGLFASMPSHLRVHESTNGNIWFVSGSFFGVAKKTSANSYKMDSLTYRILQPKIIIGFEHFNFIDKNRVLLSTDDGFNWIDTRLENAPKNTFKVFLDKILVTTHAGKVLTENATLVNRFPHSQNSLRFELVAPEFRNEGLVQYSFMLENFDTNWTESSSNNSKEYTQLPKGHYTFKVKAKNFLEPKVAVYSYSFDILPAWYESKVAMILYFILLVLIITGIFIFVKIQFKKGAFEMAKLKEIELKEQKRHFETESSERKREIKELKNQQLQYELRHKSHELASSTMNLIRKNEMLLEMMETISKASNDIKSNSDTNVVLSRLSKLERSIKENIGNDNHWKKFEENFDLVYENYLKRLGEMFPELNTSDKNLCAYLKMDLSSKDIAPLLNMSIRSVETNRYRLRKKLNLDRDVNLSEFLQRF